MGHGPSWDRLGRLFPPPQARPAPVVATDHRAGSRCLPCSAEWRSEAGQQPTSTANRFRSALRRANWHGHAHGGVLLFLVGLAAEGSGSAKLVAAEATLQKAIVLGLVVRSFRRCDPLGCGRRQSNSSGTAAQPNNRVSSGSVMATRFCVRCGSRRTRLRCLRALSGELREAAGPAPTVESSPPSVSAPIVPKLGKSLSASASVRRRVRSGPRAEFS